ATSIEYALIAGFVFLAMIGSLRLYASKVGVVYATIGNAISQN
ncbi:MAG: Flp family type IVb pilin, partial [Methylobacterium sp.]